MRRTFFIRIPFLGMVLGVAMGGCDQHSAESPQPSSQPTSQSVTVSDIATSEPTHTTQVSASSRPTSLALVSKSWRVRQISAGNAVVACHDFGDPANTALLGVMVEVENIGENIVDLNPSRACLVANGIGINVQWRKISRSVNALPNPPRLKVRCRVIHPWGHRTDPAQCGASDAKGRLRV